MAAVRRAFEVLGMNTATLRDGTELAYFIDDFTDPWRKPGTVLMIHGLAESSESWRAWVPHLARDFEVVRVDLRGYGQSTPMAGDYDWRFDQVVDDIVEFLDTLEVETA